MSVGSIPPNELADYYDGLFTLLEMLSDDSHPGWVLAIESVLFGGEGLAPGVNPYGQQQSERNGFKISTYRAQYGDGNRTTDFQAIRTATIEVDAQGEHNSPVEIPVAPDSGTPLPVSVDSSNLTEALALLNELPREPGATQPGGSEGSLLNPYRFPGISGAAATSTDSGNDKSQLKPNELSELYDGLLGFLQSLPDTTHQVWREALETMLFGGEFLSPGQSPYGEQQSQRNSFAIQDYRTQFGNGERVTDWSFLPAGDQTADTVVRSPHSGQPLPKNPRGEDLATALLLLDEFPAVPEAQHGERSDAPLLYLEGLFSEADLQRQDPTQVASPSPETDQLDQQPAQDHEANSLDEVETGSPPVASDATSGKKPFFESGVGESQEGPSGFTPEDNQGKIDQSPKYRDPRAQRAHERAQQRNPSDVVEIGEELKLVIEEVDHRPGGPTVVARKQRLVIFVEDAPQDISKLDDVRVKIMSFGGKNNSAHAAFLGYA